MHNRPTQLLEKKVTSKRSAIAHFQALRPRQWTKNLIVFAAPLFAFNINLNSLRGSCFAFVLFCAASSGFYLINDIADVKSDRQHPVKCKRPIAAGLVSIPVAIVMAIILLGSAIAFSWMHSPQLGAIITGYAILQIAYNLRLKRMVILDICAIAAGFVLRASAGAAATSVIVSPWFMLCTAMLALFLAIEKRKAELRLAKVKGGKTRAVLKKYSLPLLQRMESIVTTSAVVSYSLWSSGPVVRGASTSWMLITLPFVLYGIFRYQLLSDPPELENDSEEKSEQEERSERPEEILLKDLPILMTVSGWVVTCFGVLWLKNQGLI